MPYDLGKVKGEIRFISHRVQGSLHYGAVVVPAGRYARTTHRGPYDTLPNTWRQLMGEWLPRSTHRAGDGPSYEVYRNNPMNTKPADLITDLYVPLK